MTNLVWLFYRSTDSQLKLWDVSKPTCLRTFKGHTNEKNFVGLATDGDYVACGRYSYNWLPQYNWNIVESGVNNTPNLLLSSKGTSSTGS